MQINSRHHYQLGTHTHTYVRTYVRVPCTYAYVHALTHYRFANKGQKVFFRHTFFLLLFAFKSYRNESIFPFSLSSDNSNLVFFLLHMFLESQNCKRDSMPNMSISASNRENSIELVLTKKGDELPVYSFVFGFCCEIAKLNTRSGDFFHIRSISELY